MPFSDHLSAAVLGHVFGAAVLPKPPGLWVALFVTSPGEGGGTAGAGAGGTEVAGGGYARRPAGFVVSAAAKPITAALAASVQWPAAEAPWGTVSHVGVFDAPNGGTCLDWSPLEEAKVVGAGDVFVVEAGKLTATLA